jgi:hypothetical protein
VVAAAQQIPCLMPLWLTRTAHSFPKREPR